ncbi:MAG: LacI family DNA-binding transcriptional regulator [Anaerolineales bacterium]|nr:LacI family DNA-binding transcriptional regulator [Anaerolineales bacterium]
MAKRATAREVAERAGVSRTTVSFVLNNVPGIRISDETRRAVLAAARDLDYHPDISARRLLSGRTQVVGFVLRQNPDQAFADRFVPTVLEGFSQAASAQNYKILFETIAPTAASGSYSHLLRERHVDGIVLSGPRSDDNDLLELHRSGAPVVLLGQLPGSHIHGVDVNNRGGAMLATQHLLERGHTRLALITNADPVYTAAADRLDGYRQALEAAGLAYNPELVRYGNFTPQSGAEAMAQLLALPQPPTAVFVASDTVAFGALHAARRAGLRLPDDLALVGFDDVSLSEFLDPPLTTVRLPAYGLGYAAAEMLHRLITGDEIRVSPLILDTELIVRESSGPAAPAWKGGDR